MRFSERLGYREARDVVQIESIDLPLRTALWNTVYLHYWGDYGFYHNAGGSQIDQYLWRIFFEESVDKLISNTDFGSRNVKPVFLEGDWLEVFDLLQFIVDVALHDKKFIQQLNNDLERELSGYRIVDAQIIAVSDEVEVEAIEAAASTANALGSSRQHIKKAIGLLADRDNPDYVNVVKESISAVESLARDLTGKSSLGAALDQLKRDGFDVHPSLLEGWKKIYGYTSDEDSIRHGGATIADIDVDFARYFLVTCSAFINLLSAKKA